MKKFDKNCIFCKIANHQVEKEFIYEDNDVMVFPDLNPFKPVHLLVLPKEHIEDFMDFTDEKLEKKLFETVIKVINESELKGKGFRIMMNGGGAQIIDHLHIHITGPFDKEDSL